MRPIGTQKFSSFDVNVLIGSQSICLLLKVKSNEKIIKIRREEKISHLSRSSIPVVSSMLDESISPKEHRKEIN
jgi:hypothetical protein